jgi:hypothetical protein
MQDSAAALLAFVAYAVAQDTTPGFDPISKPGDKEAVPAGSTYQIVWQPSTVYTGPVSLTLIGGATTGTLDTVAVIAKSVDNSLGTFSWAVDSSLGSLAIYGIRINLLSNETIFQYSFPFSISGSKGSGSSSSSSSASGSTSKTVTGSASASTSSVPTLTTSVTIPIGNLSTSATNLPGKTTVTSTFTPSASASASKTTTAPSTISTSGANPTVAGPIALLGALAAAVFAL